MAERDLKKYLLAKVKRFKGEARKVNWEGRKNAPDWFIMLPHGETGPAEGACFFIELKAAGKEPTKTQFKELERMWKYNIFIAEWANCEDDIDAEFERRGYHE